MNTMLTRNSTPGSALIVVLWAVVLLGVGVVSVLHNTRLDLKVAKNQGDRVQAYFLALAGVERAKAAIYLEQEDRKIRTDGFSTALFNDASAFQEVTLGRGTYHVFRQARPGEGPGPLLPGIEDEERRLNMNQVPVQELLKLPGMTQEAAASIKDWRDPDGTLTSMGAEQEYYDELSPPLRIRNGPLETLREALVVRGITREQLLGEDWNANGLLDPQENDGTRTRPPDNADGVLDAGWSAYLTLESMVRNLNRRGEPRVHIVSATAEDLAEVEGLSEDLAAAIVDYRKVKSYSSLADLLDVKRVEETEAAPAPAPAPASARGASTGRAPARATPPPSGRSAGRRPAPTTGATGPGGNRTAPTGPQYREVGETLISQDLLMDIADGLTVREPVLEGVVNLNTADAVVLACLPGMTEDLAQAVVDHRLQNGFFFSIAGLLSVQGFTREIFKQVAPRVSVRSGTYRILSEGRIPSSGARKRVAVVVRLDDHGVKTLYYREDP